MKSRSALLYLAVAMLQCVAAAPGWAQSVTTYHGHPERSGNYVVPGLTWQRAHGMRLDRSFAPRFSGHLYAQPLYWRPPGAASGTLIVASEDDTVAAIDAHTGATRWTRALGRPASLSDLPCGNIDPLGITGTPVIDAKTGSLYLDAMVATRSGPGHRIFALSLKDGAVLPGWPVDVAQALASHGQTFNPPVQNQRGALAILDGRVYVAYGGHFGDCGDYHGWVVGLGLDHPRDLVFWRTRARGGAVWAPGGIASDGHSLFIATGNTIGAAKWSDGEAVFRLAPDLRHSLDPADFFAAADWRALDRQDADLGGSNPLPFDLSRGNGVQAVVLALGKDGRAYLLDRHRLGGIGGALAAETVSSQPIRTAPAAYPDGAGVDVAFQGRGSHCPAPGAGEGLTVLRIRAGSPPAIATAWCAALDGAGSAIVTTTDGRADPIVWILGAEGDNRLHGYRGDTGAPLFVSSGRMAGLRHFQTLLAAEGRLYIGADGRLYAFSF